MMNAYVVDGSLVVLGVLQIYSMFLPDVTSVPDSTPQVIHQEILHASIAVAGLVVVACYLTKNLFPAYVGITTAVAMSYMYLHALQRDCGCSEQETY